MTTPTELFVVANGSVDSEALQSALDVLRDHTRVEIVRTAGTDECSTCVDRLDGRRLVVAGGDGTLSNMVATVHAKGLLDDVVFGLLPLGTGNDFARTLGIPLAPQDAARVLLDGVVRTLDLVVDDRGATIVNAVHAGIGADAAEASTPLKDVLGPAAYPVGAAIAGLSGTPAQVRLHVDGDLVFEGEAIMVGIGNGKTIGGGTALVPDARPDDGLVDVVVVGAGTLARKIGFVRDLRTGEHVERDDVARFRGREIRLDGSGMRYDADGEISAERSHASFTVHPAAWRMVAPRSQ